MSDERNADSVLFKLDTLQATVQAQAKARQQQGGAAGQLARLAAATPQSEGSGLIDVKTLASSVADTPASASSSVTSSAALSQSTLLSSSSTIEPIAQPGAAKPSRTPMIVLSILAALALAAAVAAIVLRG